VAMSVLTPLLLFLPIVQVPQVNMIKLKEVTTCIWFLLSTLNILFIWIYPLNWLQILVMVVVYDCLDMYRGWGGNRKHNQILGRKQLGKFPAWSLR
jgi:hypothetical protein